MKRVARILFGAFLLSVGALCAAQTYPNRPIRIVIGFPPGGGAEIPVRMIQTTLQEQLGQPVVIENKPGAGSAIAAEYVAKSKGDGYTLLLSSTSLAVMPSRKTKMSFDPLSELTGVAGLQSGAFSIVVNPALAVPDLASLVSYAKSNPGKLSAAVSSAGGTDFLVLEHFKMLTGTNIVSVPYKGTADVDRALLSGEVMVGMGGVSTVSHVISGKLRAIAVTSPRRLPLLPEVPAVSESLPGFDGSFWSGIHAPRGTPNEVIATLNRAFSFAVQRQEVREKFAAMNVEPLVLSPSDFDQKFKADVGRWAQLVRTSGIELE